jgi:hypothetical protein
VAAKKDGLGSRAQRTREVRYSPVEFPTLRAGPRGFQVTAYEREGSGHIYLRYRFNGKLYKRALDILPYDAAGRVIPDALKAVQLQQTRVLDALLRAEDPLVAAFGGVAAGANGGKKDEKPTLESAFERYLAPMGPTTTVSAAQRARYVQTRDNCRRLFGSGIRLDELTPDHITTYANTRCAENEASKRPGRTGGRRQAEIEVHCIETVMRYAIESCRVQNIQPISTKAARKTLRAGIAPARPRFTDSEIAALMHAVSLADPRLLLLVMIQQAQRAGQLIKVKRSALRFPQLGDDTKATIGIVVPSLSASKPAGPYYLSMDRSRILMLALHSGHLSALETQYQATGEDYPLFPATGKAMPPGEVVAPGRYPPLRPDVARNWLESLERAANVQHQDGRGFHAFRRRAVDIMLENGASIEEIQSAGNWASSQIPLDVYRSGESDRHRKSAAHYFEMAPVAEPEFKAIFPQTDPPLAHALANENLSDSEVTEAKGFLQWAWEELNLRPHAYQACALTT